MDDGWDFFGLHDPISMRHFLSTCDYYLSDGSNDYNSDDEGYDPTRECFHAEHEEHEGENQLGMPRNDNIPSTSTTHRRLGGMGCGQDPHGESGCTTRTTPRDSGQARWGAGTTMTTPASPRAGNGSPSPQRRGTHQIMRCLPSHCQGRRDRANLSL
jgi:hypothetical protein